MALFRKASGLGGGWPLEKPDLPVSGVWCRNGRSHIDVQLGVKQQYVSAPPSPGSHGLCDTQPIGRTGTIL